MSDTIHLVHYDDAPWCDEQITCSRDMTTDPLDADCPACLREAATFGAKAAVRCMAVENAESFDEELKAERDAAIADATRAKKALMDRGLFVCQDCHKTRSLQHQLGYQTPGEPPLVWCSDCKARA